jgi:hypothetical protein
MELSSQHSHHLVINLSLQAGGATILTYLKSAFPSTWRSFFDLYITLAQEAAKPIDLQRWLTVLPDQAVSSPGSDDVSALLPHIRRALLAYTDQAAAIEPLLVALKQSLAHQHQLTPPLNLAQLPLSWPVALLIQLEQHHRRLQTDVSGGR